MEINNARKLQNLEVAMDLIEKKEMTKIRERIIYLELQSEIAKELGIEKGSNASYATNEFPFYMRGYKAIDKEISLIKDGTEEQMLTSPEVVEVRGKMLNLESDLSSLQLDNFLINIEKADPKDWIEYDAYLSVAKSQDKTTQYIILMMIIGGIISTIYVLISTSIQRRNRKIEA